ncbi:hypothetical protein C8J56DRAFT_761853, partial [Mycena floridula]
EGHQRLAPTQTAALRALEDLTEKIRGESRGKNSAGYNAPIIDPWTRHRLEGMRVLLNLYTCPLSKTYGKWGESALQAAISIGNPTNHTARVLCKLTRAYIADHLILPVNPYGAWNESMLTDESLMNAVLIFLNGLSNKITAEKLVQFLTRKNIMEEHDITKKISVRTAQRYLKFLGYRFTYAKKGQYTDGHDRADVVHYRDFVFLPAWAELQPRVQQWENDGSTIPKTINGCRVIIWYHDESIFYAHDRRRKAWYHKDAPPKPYSKGDGPSFMIADYVSADFGWSPKSLDGKKSAR